MFYTHPKFIDVFIYAKIKYKDHKRVKVKLEWWCKGFTGNPWLLKLPENRTFTPEKWKEFIPLGYDLDRIMERLNVRRY